MLRAWRGLVAATRILTYVVLYTVVIVGPFALLAWVVWRIVRAG